MATAAVRPTHGRVRVGDVGVAVALTAFCIVVGRKQPLTFPAARPADALQAFVIAVSCLALAFRRPFPAAAALVSAAAGAAYLGHGYTGGPILLVPLAAMYLAGYAVSRRDVWRLVGCYTAMLVVAALVTSAPAAQAWVWVLGWPPMAAALAFGGNARRRHEVDVAERGEEEDRRQHAEARQELAEQRLQTARELHDVLGHSLASITLLAGAGARRVEVDPAAAKEVLDEIRVVSATALADIRHALDALNDPTQAILDDSDADVSHLIERLRRVGLQVDERLDVDLATVDPAVALALHRIAQESLTNVMRHSGCLRASVVIEPSHDGLLMTVADQGSGAPGLREGRGIEGMRRRAEDLGGRLSIVQSGIGGQSGPNGSGLSVVAWLPVRAEVAR